MKIVLIVGTRPEAIKMWPLILEIGKSTHEPIVISTGQQREILSETLNDLLVKPDFELDIMKSHLSLIDFLNAAIIGIRNLLENIKPELVVVQGDTSSALAGSLAAHLLGLPVGHVEAGLRSGDLKSPWPEEGNRRIIDSISTLLWVPTTSEIVAREKDQIVEITGNTVVDSLRILTANKPNKFETKQLILVTLHRRESFGEQMVAAMKELIKLSQQVTNDILFIQHPNSNVYLAVKESGLDKSRIKIVNPMKYSEFIDFMSKSALLITDSGGLQEEAYSLGIPLIVVRDKTERVEALEGNSELLVGGNGKTLVTQAIKLLEIGDKTNVDFSSNEFGDGHAATKILKSIENWHSNKNG